MEAAQAAPANPPPEQRRTMAQTMALQGVSLDAGGPKIRPCLAPEDVARDGQPASGGRGTVTLQGSTGYVGDFTMTLQADTKTEPARVRTEGRWFSVDCGAVKPIRRRGSAIR